MGAIKGGHFLPSFASVRTTADMDGLGAGKSACGFTVENEVVAG